MYSLTLSERETWSFTVCCWLRFEVDAMNQLLVLPRGNGLEWWGRPSPRHSPKTLGHRRVRLDQILNLVIDGGFAANVTRGERNFDVAGLYEGEHIFTPPNSGGPF